MSGYIEIYPNAFYNSWEATEFRKLPMQFFQFYFVLRSNRETIQLYVPTRAILSGNH